MVREASNAIKGQLLRLSCNGKAMNKLILLAVLVGTTCQVALSAQKPLEITCDYYKTLNKEYGGDFLESEYIEYGNEKENNWASSHDYWVDLGSRKVLTSSFDHMKLQPTKQGDLLLLSGEKVSESYSNYQPVDTVKISINLKTMEAEVSHKQVHVYDGIELEDLDSDHYLFLDGRCRYEENFLDQR